MKKLICTFDPNDSGLIQCALEVGEPREVRAAIEHAAKGFCDRLRRIDGSRTMMLYKPATEFDAAVIRFVLQDIADTEGVTLEVQWIPNPLRISTPDIEWRSP